MRKQRRQTPKLVPLRYGTVRCEACGEFISAGTRVAWWRGLGVNAAQPVIAIAFGLAEVVGQTAVLIPQAVPPISANEVTGRRGEAVSR